MSKAYIFLILKSRRIRNFIRIIKKEEKEKMYKKFLFFTLLKKLTEEEKN